MIRPATPDDAAAIAAIWNPVIRDTTITFNPTQKTPDDIAAMIKARPVFVVASDGTDITGFATFDQFRSGLGYAHAVEHTVIIAPNAKGQGLAKALMEELFTLARAQGMHTMWAGVSGENLDGVAFHAALGFETIGILPEVGRKFDRWIDLVLMQKRL
ncbi:GNAT family N-acetyltransferase [Octadecabacter sp. R77987]|uniref:GNAT family N-acetyltransferase n=1 Tax=Octadecabacter sp. R77987 TaxID=3093874 RepID=UPI0036729DCE